MTKENAFSIIGDAAEYMLDRLTESEEIKEIPLISTVVSVIKLTKSIPDMLFANKINKFLSGLEKYKAISVGKTLISADKNESKKIGEIVLNYLNSTNESDSCDLIGFLYAKLKQKKLDVIEFKIFCRAITMTLAQDIHDLIFHYYKRGYIDGSIRECMETLAPTKLTTVLSGGQGYLAKEGTDYTLTNHGRKFVELLEDYQWEYENSDRTSTAKKV